MSEVVISVRGVGKCYRVFENQRSRFVQALHPSFIKGVEEIWALQDINFEIKRGEAVAIIGRNGGGKSTLLEILTGTLTPTTGSVKVNGRVSSILELGSGFNPEYSGRENVILNGLLLGLSKEEIINRFPEIEAFAEIGEAIERPVKTYSSGMMMRLAFAIQVLCDPDILIIDEALSVGDIFFQQKCFSFIKRLQSSGLTLLFVSHDMGAVREICNRGILLSSGRINYDGEGLEVIRRYLQYSNVDTMKTTSLEDSEKKDKINPIALKLKISEPLWSLGGIEKNSTGKLAQLIAVGIYDESGTSITSVQMGSFVKIKVHYRLSSKEEVHVHLVIKNRYDQIVTAIGSYNLRISPPLPSNSGEGIFELSIQLSIEAGDYTISASLVIPSTTEITGIIIDETQWFGPFQIFWSYEDKIPPFFGLAGMNCSGKFYL
jgi:lipopolysaccharide transport system ATP-binding protein